MGGRAYRSDVNHRRQLEDILDRGLGRVQLGRLEEGDVLGHAGECSVSGRRQEC